MEEIQRLMKIADQMEEQKRRARERARLHYERNKNDPTFKEMRRLKARTHYYEKKTAELEKIVSDNTKDGSGSDSGTESEEENV
jgi:hypothetical protein